MKQVKQDVTLRQISIERYDDSSDLEKLQWIVANDCKGTTYDDEETAEANSGYYYCKFHTPGAYFHRSGIAYVWVYHTDLDIKVNANTNT